MFTVLHHSYTQLNLELSAKMVFAHIGRGTDIVQIKFQGNMLDLRIQCLWDLCIDHSVIKKLLKIFVSGQQRFDLSTIPGGEEELASYIVVRPVRHGIVVGTWFDEEQSVLFDRVSSVLGYHAASPCVYIHKQSSLGGMPCFVQWILTALLL